MRFGNYPFLVRAVSYGYAEKVKAHPSSPSATPRLVPLCPGLGLDVEREEGPGLKVRRRTGSSRSARSTATTNPGSGRGGGLGRAARWECERNDPGLN